MADRPRPPGREHSASLKAITARQLQAHVRQRSATEPPQPPAMLKDVRQVVGDVPHCGGLRSGRRARLTGNEERIVTRDADAQGSEDANNTIDLANHS